MLSRYAKGDKEMIIYYEVEGWMGHIHMNAFGGYLIDKIEIRAPVVEPQLIIMNACWGMPRKEILHRIKEQEHPFMLREEMFEYAIDITLGIQRLIDVYGKGKALIIDTKDNLRKILDIDTSQYQKKMMIEKENLLEEKENEGEAIPSDTDAEKEEEHEEEELEHVLFISYALRGRDVCFIGMENIEKRGYLRDRLAIISPRYKSGILHQQLRESRKGRFVVPSIKIHQAIYGDLKHAMRQRDAYPAVQAMIDEEEGTHLMINGITDPNPDYLFNYFDDPNPNHHGNSIKLFYELKPFSGALKLFSRQNILTAAIKIGWEHLPIVYPEPSDVKQNYDNKIVRDHRNNEKSTRYSVDFTPVDYSNNDTIDDKVKKK